MTRTGSVRTQRVPAHGDTYTEGVTRTGSTRTQRAPAHGDTYTEGDTHGVVPRVNDVLLPAIRVLIGEDVFVLIFYMILL